MVRIYDVHPSSQTKYVYSVYSNELYSICFPRQGANDVAELLVRHGADIELHEAKQRTALEVAVESGIFPPR